MSIVIHSQMLPVLVRRAQRLGVDVDDLIARYRILPTASEVKITCAALRAVTEAIATRANDPSFGFHAALEMPPGAYGLFEYIIRNTPSLRALVMQLVRFGRLVNAKLAVTFDERTRRIEQRIVGEPEYLGKQGNEFSLAHQVKVVRDACGVRVRPERVYFAHVAPEARDVELEEYFGAGELVYASGFNGVDLSEETLDTPVKNADLTLFHVLEARAEQLVAELSDEDGLESIRRALALELQSGEPTAKHVAKLVGMSERTLHRRVAAQGTSFGDLTDALRRELALTYLSDPARSVTDVAMLVGYSDGRAFARAFRRWTNVTPIEWRTRHAKSRAWSG